MPVTRSSAAELYKSGISYTTLQSGTVEMIRDADALAVWTLLMSKPNGWIVRQKYLCDHFGFGRDRYRKVIRTLKIMGLMTAHYHQQADGTLGGRILMLHAEPIPEDQRTYPSNYVPNSGIKTPLETPIDLPASPVTQADPTLAPFQAEQDASNETDDVEMPRRSLGAAAVRHPSVLKSAAPAPAPHVDVAPSPIPAPAPNTNLIANAIPTPEGAPYEDAPTEIDVDMFAAEEAIAAQQAKEKAAKEKAARDAKRATQLNEAFDLFYNAGLVKKDRQRAKKSFEAAIAAEAERRADPLAFAQMLVDNIQQRIPLNEIGFNKLHPSSYLNKQRWEDEIEEASDTRVFSRHDCPSEALFELFGNIMIATGLNEKVPSCGWIGFSGTKAHQSMADRWDEYFGTEGQNGIRYLDRDSGLVFWEKVLTLIASKANFKQSNVDVFSLFSKEVFGRAINGSLHSNGPAR